MTAAGACPRFGRMSTHAPAASPLRRFLGALPHPEAAPEADMGRPRPRRRTGPVLMGDIHGTRGGVPLLLVLWAQWERAAAERDE